MDCLILILGSIFREPMSLTNKMIRVVQLRKVVLLITVFGVLITWMYQAMIISVLTTGKPIKPINSIQDLANTPDVKVIVFDKHFPHTLIKNSVFYPELEGRMLVMKGQKTMEDVNLAYHLTHDGTHVFVEFVVNVDEFYSSLSQDLLCLLPKEDFHTSRSLTTAAASLLYRKGLPYAETIDLAILWLQAYGIKIDHAMPSIQHLEGKSGIKTAKTNVTCTKPDDVSTNTNRGCLRSNKRQVFQLTQEHLMSLWVVTGALLMISVVVFVLEVLTTTY